MTENIIEESISLPLKKTKQKGKPPIKRDNPKLAQALKLNLARRKEAASKSK